MKYDNTANEIMYIILLIIILLALASCDDIILDEHRGASCYKIETMEGDTIYTCDFFVAKSVIDYNMLSCEGCESKNQSKTAGEN